MKHEAGNVLFIILIAVALLAALSFAVSQSGRGTIDTLTLERARLGAAEILEFGDVLANAVVQTRLRGYSDTQISFENNVVSGYTNGNCGDDVCKVFHQSGGAVTYIAPRSEWLDSTAAAASAYANVTALLGEWYFPYNTCVDKVGLGGNNCYADTASISELMVWLPWIKRDVCLAINKLIGVTNPAGEPPALGFSMIHSGANKHAGVFPAVGHAVVNLDTVLEACVYHNSAPASPGLGYFYYKVLIAR